jgi:hypothetical protein
VKVDVVHAPPEALEDRLDISATGDRRHADAEPETLEQLGGARLEEQIRW